MLVINPSFKRITKKSFQIWSYKFWFLLSDFSWLQSPCVLPFCCRDSYFFHWNIFCTILKIFKCLYESLDQNISKQNADPLDPLLWIFNWIFVFFPKSIYCNSNKQSGGVWPWKLCKIMLSKARRMGLHVISPIIKIK